MRRLPPPDAPPSTTTPYRPHVCNRLHHLLLTLHPLPALHRLHAPPPTAGRYYRLTPAEFERVRAAAQRAGEKMAAAAAALEAQQAAEREAVLAADLERRKRKDPFGEATARTRGGAAAQPRATSPAESEGWEGWGRGLGGVGAKRRAAQEGRRDAPAFARARQEQAE